MLSLVDGARPDRIGSFCALARNVIYVASIVRVYIQYDKVGQVLLWHEEEVDGCVIDVRYIYILGSCLMDGRCRYLT